MHAMNAGQQLEAAQASGPSSAEASHLAAPAREAARLQHNTSSSTLSSSPSDFNQVPKPEHSRASQAGSVTSQRSSLRHHQRPKHQQQQQQRQRQQALQQPPQQPQGASLRLRSTLIVLRFLQLAACAYNGYVAGSGARGIAAATSALGLPLPSIVVYLIAIEVYNALTAVLDIAWLVLTWRQDWRHRVGCVAGVQVPPYTADFVLDLFIGGSWFAFLISLFVQGAVLAEPIAATCVMTGVHWMCAPFDVWARSAEAAKAEQQQEQQQVQVQVQVQVQTQGQPSRKKAVHTHPRPGSPSHSPRKSGPGTRTASPTSPRRKTGGSVASSYRLPGP